MGSKLQQKRVCCNRMEANYFKKVCYVSVSKMEKLAKSLNVADQTYQILT
jgi:hypothetical protein